jgi:hypothetical protein
LKRNAATKKLEQFDKVYKKHKDKEKVTHDKLKTGNKLNKNQNLVAETKNRNVTKLYCQCQISHKRRKKECPGKFKFSLNRLKKYILRKPIFVSGSKGKVILI